MKTKGRRSCPESIKRRLIIEQTGRCIYCNGSLVDAAIEYDHFIPYAYSGRNDKNNWVASCKRCNRLKSSRVFRSEADISEFCLEMIRGHGSIGSGWPEGALEAFKAYF